MRIHLHISKDYIYVLSKTLLQKKELACAKYLLSYMYVSAARSLALLIYGGALAKLNPNGHTDKATLYKMLSAVVWQTAPTFKRCTRATIRDDQTVRGRPLNKFLVELSPSAFGHLLDHGPWGLDNSHSVWVHGPWARVSPR